METSALQADRIYVTVFVSLLVGLVTAALSIVRLVNDKEGKTSDYRQDWCDSVRKSLAETISIINSTASLLMNSAEDSAQLNSLLDHHSDRDAEWPGTDATVRDLLRDRITHANGEIRLLRQRLYHAYALTRLHFKPNDPGFAPIEQCFERAIDLIRSMGNLEGESKRSERTELRDKVHAVATEMTMTGREIIKKEWEIVKRGERAYVSTKRWSILGAGAALTILTLLGGATFISLTTGRAIPSANGDLKGQGRSQHLLSSDLQSAPIAPIHSVNQIVNVGSAACTHAARGIAARVAKPADSAASSACK